MEVHPEISRAAIRFLCARLREVSDHLEDIALLPIEARLARFILNRVGDRTPAENSARLHITLGMSQGELALLLGASRPKVNAALMLLETEGAIERVGQQLAVDFDTLTNFARRE